MMRREFAITCALFAVCLSSYDSVSAGKVSLGMEVSLLRPKPHEYVLHVKVQNNQSVPVSVLNIYLPWLTPNDFVLVQEARRMDLNHSALQKYGPTSDYMQVTYDLKPGESIEGDVKLHDMFPTFLKDIKKYGVVMRWRCKAKHIDLTCKQGAGGEFVIPKGGLPESSPSKKD